MRTALPSLWWVTLFYFSKVNLSGAAWGWNPAARANPHLSQWEHLPEWGLKHWGLKNIRLWASDWRNEFSYNYRGGENNSSKLLSLSNIAVLGVALAEYQEFTSEEFRITVAAFFMLYRIAQHLIQCWSFLGKLCQASERRVNALKMNRAFWVCYSLSFSYHLALGVGG